MLFVSFSLAVLFITRLFSTSAFRVPKFFVRILFTLRHWQSFVVAFIEQVQNIEKSRASVVEVVSSFVTVKARIKYKQSDLHLHIKQS